MLNPSSVLSHAGGPIAAAIAVLIRDGKVLLVRRANPPDAGKWGFPGGKIELGESIEDAALRELYEETGVRGQALGAFTALDMKDTGDDGTLRRHFVLIAVRCCWVSGEPQAADDVLEARWFKLAELDTVTAPMSFGVADVAHLGAAASRRLPGRY